MKSNNTKVDRLPSVLAIKLKDLPDDKVNRVHDLINDTYDGYDFNFNRCVKTARYFVRG